jgi:sulfur-carrier protein adenylyltransferase/sulfurtransferase
VTGFDYHTAFSRNLGWLRAEEQESLRGRRVAVAGMGGVGGGHLLALARLGVGAFSIADLDRFDVPNLNRQAGAFVSTIGRPKVETLAAMVRDVNPEVRLRTFDEGVTAANLDEFLRDADLFVDGFDFFAIGIRRRTFARCRELGIPALTAAPIGMGVGLLAFMPTGMSFEDYFQLDGQPEEEQYLRFLLGVAPRGLHRTYLVDPSRVDLANHRGPSTGASCLLCAGAVASIAARILLLRGGIEAAPVHHHYDAYRQRYVATRLRRGNAGPLQRLKLAVARRQFRAALTAPARPHEAAPPAEYTTLRSILEAARWAPSGDNIQPWRFQLREPDQVRIVFDAFDPANPYEYREGEPTRLSAGMLLEALRIAATLHGRTMEWRSVDDGAEPQVVEARFAPAPGLEPDPLYGVLPLRSTDRRTYKRRPLLARERATLAGTLGAGLQFTWYEGAANRLKFARLSACATRIRLRLPAAYEVHRRIIDWGDGDSPTGIPAGATGLWRPTLPLMRWAMRDWQRMTWLNRFGGARSAALQLDWAPALACAGFFTVALAPGAARDPQSLLRIGGSLLRLWLAATRLGLALQPGLAILMFAHYGATGAPFTRDARLRREAVRCDRLLRALVGDDAERLVFVGRVGEPRDTPPGQRSVRLSVPELLLRDDAERERVAGGD